jgi:hypothetical protein
VRIRPNVLKRHSQEAELGQIDKMWVASRIKGVEGSLEIVISASRGLGLVA